jgi:YidC/Oxa1 family membrane protein insertase
MANLRPVLFISLLFLGYLLWMEWQRDYGPRPQPAAVTGQADTEATDLLPPSAAPARDALAEPPGDLPSQPLEGPSPEPVQAPEMSGGQLLVTVTTDVLEVGIDLVGGTVVSARLLDYPVTLEQPQEKVQLLRGEDERLFIAQSGLLSRQGAPNHTTRYSAPGMEYQMSTGDSELRVPLSWVDSSGIAVTKTFIFKPGRYEIEVRHSLSNDSASEWTGSRYEQLQQARVQEKEGGGFTNPGRYSFNGIGFYSPEEKFQKIDFDEVADEPYQRSTSAGWLAMIQHHFFAAWIPPEHEVNTYSTQEFTPSGWPRYIARSVSPQVAVAPGEHHEFSSRLFVGPKLQDELPDIAPGLQHTVNYGIFTVFSKPLFWLLSAIHNVVGNWGWAIVFLTVLIKLAFFKLTEAQYRSMARMRKLQPRIEALKERYGDDRQRMSQAMMEMYKKEKVNPLGGCLPILVQIPIFIALYWVLLESVELRQAPFIGWINNLSARDPYFILPALNAVFMILTQRLTPTAGMDPMQAKMMKAMPVVFSILFAFFPAGLVLYWATNAGLSLAQQWYITRKIALAD